MHVGVCKLKLVIAVHSAATYPCHWVQRMGQKVEGVTERSHEQASAHLGRLPVSPERGPLEVILNTMMMSNTYNESHDTGDLLARSIATGKPRWRPRTMMTMTTSFDKGPNAPENE